MIPFYDTVSEESAACENGRVSGGARFGKQGECIDTHDFCARRGRQKCLLGSLPKPGTSGLFGAVDKVSQQPSRYVIMRKTT